jgi:hypothetical protein
MGCLEAPDNHCAVAYTSWRWYVVVVVSGAVIVSVVRLMPIQGHYKRCPATRTQPIALEGTDLCNVVNVVAMVVFSVCYGSIGDIFIVAIITGIACGEKHYEGKARDERYNGLCVVCFQSGSFQYQERMSWYPVKLLAG